MTTFIVDAQGSIVNAIVLEDGSDWTAPEDHSIVVGEYAIGGSFIDGSYTPPAPSDGGIAVPPAFPEQISDRQFFQQLAVIGTITQQEAIDAVRTGTIPAAMLAVINQLPSADQFNVTMLISGATTFERHHPKTIELGQMLGWTDQQMDELWRNAAEL